MINVLAWPVKFLFSCRHKRYTFPITVKSAPKESGTQLPTCTYVVCLDCAKQFPYDWEQMQVVWEPQQTAMQLPDAQPEIRIDHRTFDWCFRWRYGLSRILRCAIPSDANGRQ